MNSFVTNAGGKGGLKLSDDLLERSEMWRALKQQIDSSESEEDLLDHLCERSESAIQQMNKESHHGNQELSKHAGEVHRMKLAASCVQVAEKSNKFDRIRLKRSFI